MRKILIGIVGALVMASCAPKNGFEIEGEIEGIKEGTVYLKSLENGSLTCIDTAKIIDGEFEFKGKVAEPQLYLIFVEGKQAPMAFFAENTSISIKATSDSIENAIVKGSKSNTPWFNFNMNMPMKSESFKLKEDFLTAQKANDMNKMNELRDRYNQIVEKQKAYYEKFIWDNTSNVVGAYLSINFAPSLEIEKLKELITKLKAGEAANSKYVKIIEETLKAMEKFSQAESTTRIGNEAPNFSFTNVKGENITLASLKGKIVLLDFWASWCRPCRAENPNVVALYKKYATKNLEIVSISLDKEEAPWQKAIKDDGLVWLNHYWDKTGDIANLYAVQNIPHTLVIGKDGTILFKNLRGEELEAKIKSLL